MLTVILGAGASYDSDPARRPPPYYEERPPLANELFDTRSRFNSVLARYRPLAAIATELRARVSSGENLESVLADFQGRGATNPQIPSQLLAVRYYLRDVLDDTSMAWSTQCARVTTYAAFVDHLNHWSHRTNRIVNYVTFNYDYLLEDAFANLHMTFGDLTNYVPPLRVGSPNLIRPHGCVRWYQVVDTTAPIPVDASDAIIIQRASELTPADQFWIGKPERRYSDALGPHKTLVPAVALPIDNKQEFVCPSSHVERMEEILDATTVLLLIGWRGSDPAFAGVLDAHIRPGVQMFVCNGTQNDGGLAVTTLATYGLNQVRSNPLEHGFSSLLRSDELEHILDVAERAT